MTPEPEDRTVRLRQLLQPVRRYWLLFVAVVAVAVIAGVALSNSIPRQYTATATLVVSPITTNPFSSTAPTQTININTEREILRSSEVARIASESLGQQIEADSTLLNQVDVAAPSGSQVLQVSVEAPTPEEAAESANALADAYLTFRGQGASEIAVAFIDAIDQQLGALQGSDDASSRAAVASLEEQRASLAIVGDNPGRLIGRAIPPTSASSLGLPVFVAAGLAGGAILALIAVMIAARVDPRLRFADRLADLSDTQPISVRSPADLEDGRWVLRSVDAISRERGHPIPAVAVFAQGAVSAATAVRMMAACAVSEGRSVAIYLADDFSPDDITWGWPDSEHLGMPGADMILIDGSLVTSGARRATLSDRVTMSVIVASRDSKISALRGLADDLHASSSSLLTLFFKRSRPEPDPPQVETPARDDRTDGYDGRTTGDAGASTMGSVSAGDRPGREPDEDRSAENTDSAAAADQRDSTDHGADSETSTRPPTRVEPESVRRP